MKAIVLTLPPPICHLSRSPQPILHIPRSPHTPTTHRSTLPVPAHSHHPFVIPPDHLPLQPTIRDLSQSPLTPTARPSSLPIVYYLSVTSPVLHSNPFTNAAATSQPFNMMLDRKVTIISSSFVIDLFLLISCHVTPILHHLGHNIQL